MAKSSIRGRLLVSSILDRLIDNEPEVSKEPLPSQHQVLRELKLSVRRDLENLLNTRVSLVDYPEHLTELKKSLASYGLPDLSGLSFGGSKDRDDFCGYLQSIIMQFEPRLARAKVTILNATEPLDRTFHFRIEALLRTDPAPEPIVFDSDVEPATGNVQVRGGGG